jgi:hypothetical protein
MNQQEHTCPTCGKVMPVTVGQQTQPDGTKVWTSGWAKATVIMANGQETKVQHVQAQSSMVLAVKFYVTVALISAIVATGVFYGIRWYEEQGSK